MEGAELGSVEGLDALRENLDAGEPTLIKRHGRIAGIVLPISASEIARLYLDQHPEVVEQINDASEHPERAVPAEQLFESGGTGPDNT